MINYNIYEPNQRNSKIVETNKNMMSEDFDNIFLPQIGQPIPNLPQIGQPVPNSS
jgi:hypothetical protein